MKKQVSCFLLILWVALMLFPSGSSAFAQSGQTVRAYAEFLVNPTGCHQTHATITVLEQTPAGQGKQPSTTTADLHYEIRSTCEDVGDLLWYYDMHTVGAVTIDARDFKVQKNLKKASLHTTLPVFDEESGSAMNLGVDVKWTTAKDGSVQVVFEYFGVTLTEAAHPVNPLTGAVSAELVKLP